MKAIAHNKTAILEYYGEIQIIAKVFNISIEDVEYCLISKKHRINNTLRVDRNPSLGMIYRDDQRIYIHDFASMLYRGDIFDIYSSILGLNINEGSEFIELLHEIRNLMDGEEAVTPNTKKINKEKSIKVYNFSPRINLPIDNKYFLNFVTEKTRDVLNIIPITAFYVDGFRVVLPDSYRPSYVYVFDNVTTAFGNIQHIKLYSPYRKVKFMNNFNRIEIPNLPKAKNLILIKSYKDLSVLYQYFINLSFYDYNIFSLPSENYVITNEIYDQLTKAYDNIYTFMDYDNAGVISMFIYYILYDIEPICFYRDLEIDTSPEIILNVNRIITKFESTAITTQDYLDFIELLKYEMVESKHKDLYDNLKNAKRNTNKFITKLCQTLK